MTFARCLLIGILFVIGCSSSELRRDDRQPVRARRYKDQSGNFHQEIELKIGWYDYKMGAAKGLDAANQWQVSFPDSGATEGKIPAILISYPDSTQSLMLEMSIDNALLGKLLKHSLMTEIPIKRPFSDFLQEADCSKCHPADIEIKE